jgi:hypothetical protein
MEDGDAAEGDGVKCREGVMIAQEAGTNANMTQGNNKRDSN